MSTHLLLIDCPDEPGLVSKVTGTLYNNGFNIIQNHEFVDAANRHFFMRTAFSGPGSPDKTVNELKDMLPERAHIRLASAEKTPIVVMVTKEPHCIGDLLLRHAYDDLPGRICAVISNYDILQPLVEKFGIPFHHISHVDRTREEHEREILEMIENYNPEYLVLAKYMRILTGGFIDRFASRIINIHHSFLPAFMGAQPYHQAFERGVKIIGATAHFVTQDLDMGPIIAQDILPVDHTYSPEDMAQAGHDVEKIVLAKALKMVLEERVFLHKNRTVVFE